MLLAALQPLALTLHTRPSALVPAVARATRSLATAMVAGPADDAENCYLFETDEGRKYVCTENPTELAWLMGVDEKSLVSGPKPDDMNLVECAEDWTHNGTPEWVCVEESTSAADAPKKFKPLQTLLKGGRASAAAAASDESAGEDVDDEDACYLLDTDEGTKYVCTDEPAELAWFLGLEETALKKGAKPDDLELVECAEDWSHNGTPEWVCRAQEEAGVVRPAPKFKPLRSLAQAVSRISGGTKVD